MSARAGIFARNERIRDFDDADLHDRMKAVFDWLAMNLPVSDAAILNRCRAVFADTIGAGEDLEWYADTLVTHSVANGFDKDGVRRLSDLLEAMRA
jgi:hypothetical protein